MENILNNLNAEKLKAIEKVILAADVVIHGTPVYSQDGSLLTIRYNDKLDHVALEEALQELKQCV